jgi:hypothetical protein
MKTIIKSLTGLNILIALFVVWGFTSIAQTNNDYSNDPGYVNFGDLSKYMTGDNVTEVTIGSNLLQMVGKMANDSSNPKLKGLLNGLKLVEVRSFDADSKDVGDIREKINSIDQTLISKNWNRIVKVSEKKNGEYTNIYVKASPDNNSFQGLAITSIDDSNKVTFVNIVGNINVNDLGELGHEFNIPSLNKMHKNKKQ